MRMSTKGRLAVNALLDLALRESSGPVALASISARQRVSLSYLEQLFSRLRQQGLVESTRGPGGGYTLGQPAAQITVAAIVRAVDEPVIAGGRAGLDDGLSRELWRRLDAVMLEHMATISLADLIDEQLAAGYIPTPVTTRRNVTPIPTAQRMRPRAPNSVFAFGQSFAA